jgi:hypothetical protein
MTLTIKKDGASEFLPSAYNPPAADDQIILIKNRRLAGRDGALRRM